MSNLHAPSPAAGQRLDWLLRYARRCQLKLDASELADYAIKRRFTPPAWRLLCRSSRDSFIPILRNRHLAFDSLVHYTERLVEHGFQAAPDPAFLDYFIQSSYFFFDRMPDVPHEADEMILLRLATRCGGVSKAQLRRVHEWLAEELESVTTRMVWRAVLRKANEWHRRQQVVVEQAKTNCTDVGACKEAPPGWDFACGPLAWAGYDIIPLVNDINLWDEGQAMSSCLYKLRHLCSRRTEPSRFFSIRKNGLRCATLELVHKPQKSRHGPGLMDGRWQLQDCRLSHNRLPSDELAGVLNDFGRHYDTLYRESADATSAAEPARSIGSSVLTATTQNDRQHLPAGNVFCHSKAQP